MEKINMVQWKQNVIASVKKSAVPVLSFPSVQLLGITVRELISDSETQARGMIEVAKRCPAAASLSMMDLSVEAEAFGAEVKVSDDEVPCVREAIVPDQEAADALKVPEIGVGRTGVYIDAIKMAAEEIADRPVLAGVIGPFSLAGRLIGMSKIMILCRRNPQMVHTVLEKATDFLIKYIQAYKAVGANGVVIAEPAAGLVSPSIMKKFSGDYCKRIVEAVQDDDFCVVYHNCGEGVPKMIPEIIEIGAWGVHFGDAISINDVIAEFPSDVLVMGNISPVHQFLSGTPESVMEATTQLLNECGKYPNFIISSGCDIPPVSPWKNIDAFFQATEAFYQ